MSTFPLLTLCATLSFIGITTASNAGALLSSTSPAVLGGTSHECYRDCVAGDNRICYYELTVVQYSTMSAKCKDCPFTPEDCYNQGCLTAGGDVRLVTVANYMLPGPSIQVCKGDRIVAKVINALGSDTTSIHWHGLHQIDTPFYDGVPFVSQCPIIPGSSFVYDFVAEPAGSHVWHSHSGLQEDDGLYGAVIIREDPEEDVNSGLYDFDLPEHVFVIWHWYPSGSGLAIAGALYEEELLYGYSFTINGLGAMKSYSDDSGTEYYTPRAKFTVTRGKSYRFRLMANMGLYCPVQVSMDGHKMRVIAGDGNPFEPVEVESVILGAAERLDVVITADQEVDNYWMRVRGLGFCQSDTVQVHSEAILHYEGAGTDEPSSPTGYDEANRDGVLLNPVAECDVDYSNNTLIRLIELVNTNPEAQDVSGTPDQQFYIPFGVTEYPDWNMAGFYAQVNWTSWSNVPVPFLTQHDEIDESMYCTPHNDDAKVCDNSYCTCPTIYELALGSLVELILVDESPQAEDDHPFHLHGHSFYLVAQGYQESTITVEEVKALDEAGLIERDLESPISKDTVGVPAHGFAVIRFHATNAGYWFLHCHIAAHLEEGMGIVFKVGDQSQMPPIPFDIPKCH